MVEHALLDHQQLLALDALAIEGPRRLAAQPQRLVGHGDAGRGDLLAHHVAQEAGLARDGSAVDRARQMAGNAARDARIEDDVTGPVLALRGVQAAHRALAGLAADRFGASRSAKCSREEYS